MAKDTDEKKKKKQDTGGTGTEKKSGKKKETFPAGGRGGYLKPSQEYGGDSVDSFVDFLNFFSSDGDDGDKDKETLMMNMQRVMREKPEAFNNLVNLAKQINPAQAPKQSVKFDVNAQTEFYNELALLGGNVKKVMEMVTGNDVAKASVSPRQPTMSTRGAPQMMQVPEEQDMTKQLVTGTVAQVLSNAMSAMSGASKGTAASPFTAQTQAAKATAQEVQRKRAAEAKVAASVRDKNFQLMTQYYDAVDEALRNYDKHFTELEKKRMDNMANIFDKGIETYQEMLGMRKELVKNIDKIRNKAYRKEAELNANIRQSNAKLRQEARFKQANMIQNAYRIQREQRAQRVKNYIDPFKGVAAMEAAGVPIFPANGDAARQHLAKQGYNAQQINSMVALNGNQAGREFVEGLKEVMDGPLWFKGIDADDRRKINELFGVVRTVMESGAYRKGGIKNLVIDVMNGDTTIDAIKSAYRLVETPDGKKYYSLYGSALQMDKNRANRYFRTTESPDGLVLSTQFTDQRDAQAAGALTYNMMWKYVAHDTQVIMEEAGIIKSQKEEEKAEDENDGNDEKSTLEQIGEGVSTFTRRLTGSEAILNQFEGDE